MQDNRTSDKDGDDRLVSRAHGGLTGAVDVPGDKSISHRALIIGGLAIGTTRITGLLEGDDVMATAGAMKALGARIEHQGPGAWSVRGVGTHGLVSPEAPLDLGNSGTGARLLMGVVAGQRITATFSGDASLSVRPMARITEPLSRMGAKITSREGGLLPVTIKGTPTPLAADYHSPVASAQIKSAILLAGINARGASIIHEPSASRDHTESMLRHFGADVRQEVLDDGIHRVELQGEARLMAGDIAVPRDPSSAAFAMVAALITPGSEIVIKGVGLNPLRTGLIETLREMNGKITITNKRIQGGEPIADLEVRASDLVGVEVPANRAASMIDEYPVLSIAACMARGTTHMRGVGELRVKETDRIAVMAEGINAAGGTATFDDDSMRVEGVGLNPVAGFALSKESTKKPDGGVDRLAGGNTVDCRHDHRIAMSFLVLGMVSKAPVTVTGCRTIATSYPGFAESMNGLGARISPAEAT